MYGRRSLRPLDNAQLPISNAQVTRNAQLPSLFRSARAANLEVGRWTSLGVGSWKLGIDARGRYVTIVGGGLAGSEAAWQAAARGVPVVLHEMRPVKPTAVHKTDGLAELVCSNSFRGDKLDNAVGLLKEEMRRLGSLVMRAADETRVPAGAALAVDRDVFSSRVTEAIASHPLISIRRGEVASIPSGADGPVIIATGPLTSDALSAEIAALVGSQHLYFYDAISPDRPRRVDRPFESFPRLPLGSQFPQRGGSAATKVAGTEGASHLSQPACGVDDGEGDYLNCPFTKDEYERFYAALMAAEKAGCARVRQADVLRRLFADRSDGVAWRRYAAVWADEAGRAHRSAHWSRSLRDRTAPAGQHRRATTSAWSGSRRR